MAVERIPQFVINIGNVIQERLNSFYKQRQLIRARQEAEFQRRVLEENLSLEAQLSYRQHQLEEEQNKNFPDQDFIADLKKEIAGLKALIRQRKFRNEYLSFLKEAAEGRKSVSDEIDFLNDKLNDVLDEETKDQIRDRIISLTRAKTEIDRAVADQEIDFYSKDKTIQSIDKAIDLVKKQLQKPQALNNPEIATAYQLKLQNLQKERASIVAEEKLTRLAIETARASDYAYPSVRKINLIQKYLSEADDTTPVVIDDIRYNSEKEFWQTTLDRYINDQFTKDFVDEISKSATLLKRQKGELPDGFLEDVSDRIKTLKNNPVLKNYQDALTNLSQEVQTTLLQEKIDEVKNKFNLGTSLATRFDVWKAKNELSKYQKYFPDLSLEPIFKQFDVAAAEQQVQISQDVLRAAIDYQVAHPETSFSEAIKKVSGLVGATIPQEEFVTPKTTEELGKKLAEVAEKPEKVTQEEKKQIETIKKEAEKIKVPKPTEEQPPKMVKPTEAEEEGMITHTLKAGETLWGVAKQYLGSGKRWKELLKPEGTPFTKEEAKRLQVGQVIKIPKPK